MDQCRCKHDATKDDDTRNLVHIDEVARAVGLVRDPDKKEKSRATQAKFRAAFIDSGLLRIIRAGKHGYQYIEKAQAERVLGKQIRFWE